MTGKPKDTDATTSQSVETTGHEWDGIKELNNPLPRWWLWTFYATIIWALAYMVVYPSWPLVEQATRGLFGYSSRAALEAEIARYSAANALNDDALVNRDLASIAASPELASYAMSGGAALFRTHCAQCHGSGAAGARGYPNLLDDEWLWGGGIEDIYQTIRHGIREENDDDSRVSEMPAFADVLERDELADVRHYVLSLSGAPHNPSLVSSGAQIFVDNCASCHGEAGQGDREFGAPSLADAIWLYGGSQQNVSDSIARGRKGMMPAWQTRLSESQIRQVSFYVHQLGGGE
jgi:cytochrome c oxidase cbb3-type subunit 3